MLGGQHVGRQVDGGHHAADDDDARAKGEGEDVLGDQNEEHEAHVRVGLGGIEHAARRAAAGQAAGRPGERRANHERHILRDHKGFERARADSGSGRRTRGAELDSGARTPQIITMRPTKTSS